MQHKRCKRVVNLLYVLFHACGPALYIRYDTMYFTCSKKLTCSQLSPPHGTNRKIKQKNELKINREASWVRYGPVGLTSQVFLGESSHDPKSARSKPQLMNGCSLRGFLAATKYHRKCTQLKVKDQGRWRGQHIVYPTNSVKYLTGSYRNFRLGEYVHRR